MKPLYRPCSVFTAVFTPHFREQMNDRLHLLPDDWNPEDELESVFMVAKPDITFGYQRGQAYIYGKKKYNRGRGRWELEFISVTPADRFHTEKLRFAQRINL